MTATSALELRQLDRKAIQPFLGQLSEWLLPGALYGVQHTWPQLYRSDGDGSFLGLFAGERLISHLACRCATASTAQGPRRIALLGSVATDPGERGRGHASRLLRRALAACRQQGASAVLLWAERSELYARQGFVPGAPEQAVLLTNAAGPAGGHCRLADIGDHVQLHALHAQKPQRIERDLKTMSGLLTTPGLWTCVLERDARIVAYACSGKGADLQNWWHELGGADADVAALLPAAMALVGQPEAFVLQPPYRTDLAQLLRPHAIDTVRVAGPMVRALGGILGEVPPPAFWVDGLDSV